MVLMVVCLRAGVAFKLRAPPSSRSCDNTMFSDDICSASSGLQVCTHLGAISSQVFDFTEAF